MLEDKLSGIKTKVMAGLIYGAVALGGATFTYGCGSTGSYTPSSSSNSSSSSDHDHYDHDHDKGGHYEHRDGHYEKRSK